MEKAEVVIRQYNSEDKNFVIASWLKSYRHGSYFAKRISSTIYYKFHHAVAERIIARANITIACDPVDPSVIFGYMISEKFEDKDVIHFTYIKSAFRGMGVGKSILEACNINLNSCYITHWTTEVDTLSRKYPDMLYVPYLI